MLQHQLGAAVGSVDMLCQRSHDRLSNTPVAITSRHMDDVTSAIQAQRNFVSHEKWQCPMELLLGGGWLVAAGEILADFVKLFLTSDKCVHWRLQ